MKDQIPPTPNQEDPIFEATEYFKIEKAAGILKCKPEDLLHMGAVGKLAIMAPVVSGGVFQWPVGINGLGFPEIDEPQKREFGLTDRVFLSIPDITKIEANGWVIPKRFSSPSKAQDVIDYIHTWMSEPSDKPNEIMSQREENGEVVESWEIIHLNPWKPDNVLIPLREIGLFTPWHAVRAFKKNAKRTTINHLYISKIELVRLLNQHPQVSVALAPVQQVHEEAPPSTEVGIGKRTIEIAKIKPKTSKRPRINPLTLAIKTAQKRCNDPLDYMEVWTVLSKMADKQEHPIVRIINTTLYWEREIGKQTSYEKNSLRMKLYREKNT